MAKSKNIAATSAMSAMSANFDKDSSNAAKTTTEPLVSPTVTIESLKAFIVENNNYNNNEKELFKDIADQIYISSNDNNSCIEFLRTILSTFEDLPTYQKIFFCNILKYYVQTEERPLDFDLKDIINIASKKIVATSRNRINSVVNKYEEYLTKKGAQATQDFLESLNPFIPTNKRININIDSSNAGTNRLPSLDEIESGKLKYAYKLALNQLYLLYVNAVQIGESLTYDSQSQDRNIAAEWGLSINWTVNNIVKGNLSPQILVREIPIFLQQFNSWKTNLNSIKQIEQIEQIEQIFRREALSLFSNPEQFNKLVRFEQLSEEILLCNQARISLDENLNIKSVEEFINEVYPIFSELISSIYTSVFKTTDVEEYLGDNGYRNKLKREILNLSNQINNLPYDIPDKLKKTFYSVYRLLQKISNNDPEDENLKKLTRKIKDIIDTPSPPSTDIAFYLLNRFIPLLEDSSNSAISDAAGNLADALKQVLRSIFLKVDLEDKIIVDALCDFQTQTAKTVVLGTLYSNEEVRTGTSLLESSRARYIILWSLILSAQPIFDKVNENPSLQEEFSVLDALSRRNLGRYDSSQGQWRILRSAIRDLRNKINIPLKDDASNEQIKTRENLLNLLCESPIFKGLIQKIDLMDLPFITETERAQKVRSEMIRQSPAFQTLFQTIRQTPELFTAYREVVLRNKEFRKNQFPNPFTGEEISYRGLAPIFAALAIDERLSPLLNRALDDFTRERKEALWKAIEDGSTLPFAVVGAGPSATQEAIREFLFTGGSPFSLFIERSNKLGGQFSIAERDVNQLNSRVRPDNPDHPNLPGTEGSINPFRYGPVQEADIGGKDYLSNDEFSLVGKLNMLLSANILTGVELELPLRDPNDSYKYLVTLVNLETGETKKVFFDFLDSSTGVNKERTKLNTRDETTRRTIESERGLPLEERGYRTYQEDQAFFGNQRNPFPLRNVQKVIVIGDGDGGCVKVGQLVGVEGQIGKTIHTLDRVETVYWAGQKLSSREKAIDNLRVRYHRLTNFMPREAEPEYYHQIKPYGQKAWTISSEIIVLEDGRTKKVMHVTLDDGTILSGDLILDCTGFEGQSDDLFKYLDGISIVPLLIESTEERESIISTEGALFTYENSENRKAEIISVETKGITKFITVQYTPRLGHPFNVTKEWSSSIAANQIFNELSIQANKIYLPGEPLERVDYLDNNGNPIARQYKNENIFFTGPASGLPVTDEEKSRSPVVKRVVETIGENSVAMFIHADRQDRYTFNKIKEIREFGRNDFTFENSLVQKGNNLILYRSKYTIDNKPLDGEISLRVKDINPNMHEKRDFNKEIPYSVGYALNNISIATEAIPEREIKVQFIRDEENDTGINFRFCVTAGNLSGNDKYDILRRLEKDPLIREMVMRFTDPTISNAKGVEISIPLKQKKINNEPILVVDIGFISLRRFR